MSAEGAGLLREAARLMRERANGIETHPDWWDEHAEDWLLKTSGTPQLAEHMASWHPAVALAVADLLDNLASDEPWDFRHDDALAVARAYLESASQ